MSTSNTLETLEFRQEVINGGSCITNLPPGVQPFTPPYGGITSDEFPEHLNTEVIPDRLDDLPLGVYYCHNQPGADLSALDQLTSGDHYPRKAVRKIEIISTRIGKAITAKTVRMYPVAVQDNAGGLLTALGHVTRRGFPKDPLQIYAIPTPRSLQTAAEELGVSIRFFPDYGVIPGYEYLEAYADGKHPVSTMDTENYTHDTGDDHLTALILGGSRLRDILASAARKLLSSGPTEIDSAAGSLDSYTNWLRLAATNNTYQPISTALRAKGLDLGITPRDTDAMITLVRKQAVKYGMRSAD